MNISGETAAKTAKYIMCCLGPYQIQPENKMILNDMTLVDLKSWALPGERVVDYFELKRIAKREQFEISFSWNINS